MKCALLKTAGLVLFWLATANSCPALLGENESQLEHRYGKFIPEMTHHLGPLVVRCYFVRDTVMTSVMLRRGRSICELYARGDSQPLSERMILAMLQGNARGEKWQEVPPQSGVDRLWTLGNKKAWAVCLAKADHPGIMVYTAAWLPYARDYGQAEKSAQIKTVRP